LHQILCCTVPDSFYLVYARKEAERKALEKGLISRDTILIGVRDSLFSDDFNPDSLRYVPRTGAQFLFEMGVADILTGSKVTVNVFEAKVHNDFYLKGLNRQSIVNLTDAAEQNDKFPGLKVGSLVSATNNAGNWE